MSKSISETLPLNEGGLGRTEVFWRENYQWFWDQGYQLRSRYAPDWTPSWGNKPVNYLDYEDGVALFVSNLNFDSLVNANKAFNFSTPRSMMRYIFLLASRLHSK
jgi:hypothetical protein